MHSRQSGDVGRRMSVCDSQAAKETALESYHRSTRMAKKTEVVNGKQETKNKSIEPAGEQRMSLGVIERVVLNLSNIFFQFVLDNIVLV